MLAGSLGPRGIEGILRRVPWPFTRAVASCVGAFFTKVGRAEGRPKSQVPPSPSPARPAFFFGRSSGEGSLVCVPHWWKRQKSNRAHLYNFSLLPGYSQVRSFEEGAPPSFVGSRAPVETPFFLGVLGFSCRQEGRDSMRVWEVRQ